LNIRLLYGIVLNDQSIISEQSVIMSNKKEFYIQPYLNGIKLLKLNDDNYEKMFKYSMDNLFKNPFNIYFLNKENKIMHVNEEQVRTCGFKSAKEVSGQYLQKIFDQDLTEILDNNFQIIQSKQIRFYDEEFTDAKEEVSLRALSLKFPWYSERNHILGVFGCSFVFGIHNLSQCMENVAHFGFLDSYIAQTKKVCYQTYNMNLTKREVDCLNYTIQKKTSKEIAKMLKISYRTVEKYLENIKRKMHVHSKQELMDIIIDKKIKML